MALLRQLNMLANYDIIFNPGTGKIDQSSSTGGTNLLKAITMNTNADIILQGTGIIDGTSSTGQCIFNTLKFNTSTTNQQITLYENSATNLATNYTISVEGSRIRYNVNSGAAHLFSSGTGVSTYTTHATINSTGLTMAGNRNVVQSGTGILSQTGTGINLMKNITLNVDNNLLQSGIGVITQSGTGTNALKGSTFSGSNTHYNGSLITQYDSTNTYNTSLSQVGANYFISNDTNGGATYIRNKTLGGVSNDIAITAIDMLISKNTYIQNSNVLVLQDTSAPITQTNINQSGGNLYIQNLTGTGGYIYTNVYDATSSLITILLAHYTAFSLRTGVPLRVWDTANAYYTQLSQSSTTGYLTNPNNGASLILRTTSSGGSSVDNITMTPTNTTIANRLTCSNGFTLSGGTLILPNSSVSDSALTNNVPLRNVENIYSATQKFNGDNYNSIECFSPIRLQTDYVSRASNQVYNFQLGYITTATFINTTAYTISSGVGKNIAYIDLPAGVWNIIGQGGCRNTNTGVSPIYNFQLSISTTTDTIDNACITTDQNNLYASNNIIRQVSRTIFYATPSSLTRYYLVLKLTGTGGTIVYDSTSYAYTNIYATRIG